MAPGGNKNPVVVLSEKVGVSLEEAVANLKLLKKSLSASTDSELEAAKEQLTADKLELEALKAQLKIAESQLKDCHAQLQAAKSELETAHKQLDEARAELEAARSHLEAAKAQADINSVKLEAAKASLEAAKARFEAATKQLNAAKSRFEAAKSQLDSARANLEEEKSHLLDEIAALEKRVSEAESKNAKLEKEKLALNSLLEKRKTAGQELSEKMKEVSEQLEQCKKDKKTMQEVELPGLREKVKELEEQLKKCREEKKDTTENEKPKGQGNGNPKVFLDLAAQRGVGAGRLVIELHADTPIAAGNFRALCTGGKGSDGSGTPISFKGSKLSRLNANTFHGGRIFTKSGDGVVSLYESSFPAENLMKKHNGPGLLSMFSYKGNTGTCDISYFLLTIAPAREYDGQCVLFGQVVEGMDVLFEMMNAGATFIVIEDCGQIYS